VLKLEACWVSALTEISLFQANNTLFKDLAYFFCFVLLISLKKSTTAPKKKRGEFSIEGIAFLFFACFFFH